MSNPLVTINNVKKYFPIDKSIFRKPKEFVYAVDDINLILNTDGYLPNGLYWCCRSGDRVSKRLKRLMTHEKIYWIEIEGFDEFMAELNNCLKLKLPNSVRDPYKATTEKLNSFPY